ncbi:MAG: outer membrane protein assembly factor BamD [Acidobacteria bacterium]|nr:outer membrane protein assembly factor BamD [Acidobacteriota bacterium]
MRKHIFVTLAASVALLVSVGCGRKAYENPIATNSQQPDKILFDKAINDLETRRYELTRLTLNTLINTYPDSEYIAKAKLAIADSWYREGTSAALAQAEAEYRDFQTFFPSMEEASESQMKICKIHYDQMHSADREQTHVRKADQECRQMLAQNPNSRHGDATRQMLREVQEVLADGEYQVGVFYSFKGSYRAGSNRLQAVTDHYPLFSGSDEALWLLADVYGKMGDEYAEQRADALSKLVRDYPLSAFLDSARQELVAMNRPVPESDPARYELMKYNLDHRTKEGMFKKTLTMFSTGPDITNAAKMGDPVMTALTPTTPVGVGQSRITGGGTAGVTVETISGQSKLDTEPDARRGVQQPEQPEQPQQEQPK